MNIRDFCNERGMELATSQQISEARAWRNWD